MEVIGTLPKKKLKRYFLILLGNQKIPSVERGMAFTSHIYWALLENKSRLNINKEFPVTYQFIQIILLDTRWFADPSTGDILGETQWSWLEQELKSSPAQWNIITSGIQVLPAHKLIQEKWANYVFSRHRLFDIIAKNKVNGTFLLSGDVHYAEMFQTNCSGIGYPLFELTSSGMTHSLPAASFSCPLMMDTLLFDIYRLTEKSYYCFRNFGTLEFEWEPEPSLTFQVRDVNGTVVLSHKVLLKNLQHGILQASANKSELCVKSEVNLVFIEKWTIEEYKFIQFPVYLFAIIFLYRCFCKKASTRMKEKKTE
jgi:hypothetical protein